MRHEDDSGKRYFRGDRVFNTGDQWWFSTREGKDEGPYHSREEAELNATRFAQAQQELAHLEKCKEFKSRIGLGGAPVQLKLVEK
jgi:hypothetical protein